MTSLRRVEWLQGKLALLLLPVSLSIGLEIIGGESTTIRWQLLWLQLQHYLDPVVHWPLDQNVEDVGNDEGNDDVRKVIGELYEGNREEGKGHVNCETENITVQTDATTYNFNMSKRPKFLLAQLTKAENGYVVDVHGEGELGQRPKQWHAEEVTKGTCDERERQLDLSSI